MQSSYACPGHPARPQRNFRGGHRLTAGDTQSPQNHAVGTTRQNGPPSHSSLNAAAKNGVSATACRPSKRARYCIPPPSGSEGQASDAALPAAAPMIGRRRQNGPPTSGPVCAHAVTTTTVTATTTIPIPVSSAGRSESDDSESSPDARHPRFNYPRSRRTEQGVHQFSPTAGDTPFVPPSAMPQTHLTRRPSSYQTSSPQPRRPDVSSVGFASAGPQRADQQRPLLRGVSWSASSRLEALPAAGSVRVTQLVAGDAAPVTSPSLSGAVIRGTDYGMAATDGQVSLRMALPDGHQRGNPTGPAALPAQQEQMHHEEQPSAALDSVLLSGGVEQSARRRGGMYVGPLPLQAGTAAAATGPGPPALWAAGRGPSEEDDVYGMYNLYVGTVSLDDLDDMGYGGDDACSAADEDSSEAEGDSVLAGNGQASSSWRVPANQAADDDVAPDGASPADGPSESVAGLPSVNRSDRFPPGERRRILFEAAEGPRPPSAVAPAGPLRLGADGDFRWDLASVSGLSSGLAGGSSGPPSQWLMSSAISGRGGYRRRAVDPESVLPVATGLGAAAALAAPVDRPNSGSGEASGSPAAAQPATRPGPDQRAPPLPSRSVVRHSSSSSGGASAVAPGVQIGPVSGGYRRLAAGAHTVSGTASDPRGSASADTPSSAGSQALQGRVEGRDSGARPRADGSRGWTSAPSPASPGGRHFLVPPPGRDGRGQRAEGAPAAAASEGAPAAAADPRAGALSHDAAGGVQPGASHRLPPSNLNRIPLPLAPGPRQPTPAAGGPAARTGTASAGSGGGGGGDGATASRRAAGKGPLLHVSFIPDAAPSGVAPRVLHGQELMDAIRGASNVFKLSRLVKRHQKQLTLRRVAAALRKLVTLVEGGHQRVWDYGGAEDDEAAVLEATEPSAMPAGTEARGGGAASEAKAAVEIAAGPGGQSPIEPGMLQQQHPQQPQSQSQLAPHQGTERVPDQGRTGPPADRFCLFPLPPTTRADSLALLRPPTRTQWPSGTDSPATATAGLSALAHGGGVAGDATARPASPSPSPSRSFSIPTALGGEGQAAEAADGAAHGAEVDAAAQLTAGIAAGPTATAGPPTAAPSDRSAPRAPGRNADATDAGAAAQAREEAAAGAASRAALPTGETLRAAEEVTAELTSRLLKMALSRLRSSHFGPAGPPDPHALVTLLRCGRRLGRLRPEQPEPRPPLGAADTEPLPGMPSGTAVGPATAAGIRTSSKPSPPGAADAGSPQAAPGTAAAGTETLPKPGSRTEDPGGPGRTTGEGTPQGRESALLTAMLAALLPGVPDLEAEELVGLLELLAEPDMRDFAPGPGGRLGQGLFLAATQSLIDRLTAKQPGKAGVASGARSGSAGTIDGGGSGGRGAQGEALSVGQVWRAVGAISSLSPAGVGRVLIMQQGWSAAADAGPKLNARFSGAVLGYVRRALARGAVAGEEAAELLHALGRFKAWPGRKEVRAMGISAAPPAGQKDAGVPVPASSGSSSSSTVVVGAPASPDAVGHDPGVTSVGPAVTPSPAAARPSAKAPEPGLAAPPAAAAAAEPAAATPEPAQRSAAPSTAQPGTPPQLSSDADVLLALVALLPSPIPPPPSTPAPHLPQGSSPPPAQQPPEPHPPVDDSNPQLQSQSLDPPANSQQPPPVTHGSVPTTTGPDGAGAGQTAAAAALASGLLLDGPGLPESRRVEVYCKAFCSLVHLGIQPSGPWVSAFLEAVVPHLAALEPGMLCRVFWGLAALRWLPAPAQRRALMDALGAAVPRMSAEELCMMLNSFGKWRHRPNRAWMEPVYERIRATLPDFQATTCTALAVALARMNLRPSNALLVAFLERTRAQLPFMDGRLLVNCLWALHHTGRHRRLDRSWRETFLAVSWHKLVQPQPARAAQQAAGSNTAAAAPAPRKAGPRPLLPPPPPPTGTGAVVLTSAVVPPLPQVHHRHHHHHPFPGSIGACTGAQQESRQALDGRNPAAAYPTGAGSAATRAASAAAVMAPRPSIGAAAATAAAVGPAGPAAGPLDLRGTGTSVPSRPAPPRPSVAATAATAAAAPASFPASSSSPGQMDVPRLQTAPFSPSHLALLLLLVSRAGLRPGPIWRRAFWAASQATLEAGCLTPVALAALLNGVWALRVVPPLGWLRAFYAASKAALPRFPAGCLVQFANALVRCPLRPRGDWVAAFRQRMELLSASLTRPQVSVCTAMMRKVSSRSRWSLPRSWRLTAADGSDVVLYGRRPLGRQQWRLLLEGRCWGGPRARRQGSGPGRGGGAGPASGAISGGGAGGGGSEGAVRQAAAAAAARGRDGWRAGNQAGWPAGVAGGARGVPNPVRPVQRIPQPTPSTWTLGQGADAAYAGTGSAPSSLPRGWPRSEQGSGLALGSGSRPTLRGTGDAATDSSRRGESGTWRGGGSGMRPDFIRRRDVWVAASNEMPGRGDDGNDKGVGVEMRGGRDSIGVSPVGVAGSGGGAVGARRSGPAAARVHPATASAGKYGGSWRRSRAPMAPQPAASASGTASRAPGTGAADCGNESKGFAAAPIAGDST